MPVKLCPKCHQRMFREGKEWVCIYDGTRIVVEDVPDIRKRDEQRWNDYFANRAKKKRK